MPRLPFPAAPIANNASRSWLLTFTDLVCLMLTFFVMLYAMSEPETRRYESLASALSGRSHPRADGQEPERALYNVASLDRGQAIELGYLGKVLEVQTSATPELAGLTLTRRDGILVATLPGDLLFAPGSSDMLPEGRRALFALGGIVANIGNAIEIIGHTDPSPVASAAFPSNWELSLARARSVAAAFRASGYLRDIAVRGQGDADYARIPAILPQPERYRLARRVEIAIRQHGDGR